MKKIILPVLISLLVFATVTSCKKTVKAIFPEQTFDLPEVVDTLPRLDSIRITGFPVIEIPLDSTYPLPPIVQHFNMDSIVKANTGNNFGAGDITSVKVKSIKLKIVTGADANNNLANFENANFKFSSNTNLNAVQVATVTFDDVYAVEKTISGDGTPELRTYLSGTELYYNITASLRRHTTHIMRVSIVATLTMK